jgi:hypothetical protein
MSGAARFEAGAFDASATVVTSITGVTGPRAAP